MVEHLTADQEVPSSNLGAPYDSEVLDSSDTNVHLHKGRYLLKDIFSM